MKWIPGGRSDDLEDRRGEGGGGGGASGGGGFGGRRIGLGGLVVLIALSVIFKRDLVSGAIGLSPAGSPATSTAPSGGRSVGDPAEEKMVQFMEFVLDSAQANWRRQIDGYHNAKLVLFRNEVSSACGLAEEIGRAHV